MDASDCRFVPWSRGDWSGSFVSADGTIAGDFTEDQIASVVAYRDSGDRWDGLAVGLVRLLDGRYVGWECFWGPTGDGFSRDAYGGDADIWFSASPQALIGYFSEEGRSLLTSCNPNIFGGAAT